MNLEREAKIVQGLLDKADRLEGDASKKTAEADDCRWEAARRTSEALNSSGQSQRAFAAQFGLSQARVTEMVRVWQKFANNICSGDRPLYWEAVWMASEKDSEGLKQRAIEQGRKPSTVRQNELKAAHTLQVESSAKAVLSNPAVRSETKRHIREIEEAEAQRRADDFHRKALAEREAAGLEPLNIPLPSTTFGIIEALDASNYVGAAMKAMTMLIKLVHERGPVPEPARGALLEELSDLHGRVQWAMSAVADGAMDWDEALAQLGGTDGP